MTIGPAVTRVTITDPPRTADGVDFDALAATLRRTYGIPGHRWITFVGSDDTTSIVATWEADAR